METNSQGPLVMAGDRNQIRRLLLNLLDNAIKYTPEKGKITVHSWQEQNFIRMDVMDTGIGIPEADLPHIFDRFYRVDKSRSSSGYGLGLSISKSIVEAHQGHIEVQTILAQGSTFSLFFPQLLS